MQQQKVKFTSVQINMKQVSYLNTMNGFKHSLYTILQSLHMRGSRGGQGVRTPHPEKSQAIGFLSKTGPDSMKNHKLPSQHSMLIRRWVVDGPILVVFGYSLPSSAKKNVVGIGPPLAKLSGSAHVAKQKHKTQPS